MDRWWSEVARNIVGKQLNVRATYDTLMRNEWIIEDPIIFKASKIGAVIVTMWDKEAEDSMFDKYR